MGYAPHFATRYTAMEIATADRFELLLLLYQAAIREAKQAIHHFEERDIEQRVFHLNKVCAIIGELRAALDFDRGGEIARSLGRLYHYMTARLTDANLRKTAAPVREVVQLLEILLSAWEEAHSKASTEDSRQASDRGYEGNDRLTLHSSPTGSNLSLSL